MLNGINDGIVEKKAPVRRIRGIKVFHTQEEDLTIFPKASVNVRFFAIVVDLIFFGLIYGLLEAPFQPLLEKMSYMPNQNSFLILSRGLYFITYLIYFLIPVVLWGQTLGKFFFGIRVVNGNCRGSPKVFQVAIRETVGKLLSVITLFIGFLIVSFNDDRKALHDLVSFTCVIKYR